MKMCLAKYAHPRLLRSYFIHGDCDIVFIFQITFSSLGMNPECDDFVWCERVQGMTENKQTAWVRCLL